jgi:hypothetical protein
VKRRQANDKLLNMESWFMTLVKHVGGQLIEEDKFGKDKDICPHSLKKKSQRCGATLSLVKDQFGGTIGRKKKACDMA